MVARQILKKKTKMAKIEYYDIVSFYFSIHILIPFRNIVMFNI